MTVYSTPTKFKFPILQWDDAERLWVLTEDYIFTWLAKGIEKRLTIRAGYKYDKASVPQPLWGIARADGQWEASSALHDFTWYHCQHGGTFPPGAYQNRLPGGTWKDCPKMSQWESNWLLEYAGHLGGATKWEAFQYRWGVTLYPPNWFKGF